MAGDTDEAFAWQKKHAEKKELINKFYWDETDGFYYDIFCKNGEFCKVQTIASYWTLTAGVATENRAKRFAEYVSDPRKFGGDVPLVSLARDDADFHNLTGNYWRGSMWLPAAYAALKGLNEYGFYKEAQEAAEKIFMRMLATFEEYEPHTVWECYSPDLKRPATQTDDEEIVRSDFCGWSALGPISVYIEFVLGFHKVDAFENSVEWYKPNVKGKIGIKNLRFGEIVTDIIADEKNYIVTTNAPYSLKINGKTFNIIKGKNEFVI